MTGAVGMYQALPPSGRGLYHMWLEPWVITGYVPGAAPVGVIPAALVWARMWRGSAGGAG